MRRLILTADDFGLSPAVNEAIEEAHRRGALSAASLMVGAKAAEDAVERARRLPSLGVGLHLVVAGGTPISNPQTIPDLVNSQGELPCRLFRAGVAFFFKTAVRRQLEQEIRAQFEAFRNTGLVLDHVNCHNHMHLHPTIGALMLKVGHAYGLKAVRYPYEPILPSWRASRNALGRKLLSWLFLSPWLMLLRRRLRKARVCSNDFVFGMNDTGNMTLDLVLRVLVFLPPGVTEIYFHPASRPCPEIDRTMSNYRCQEEFSALTSPALDRFLRASAIQRIAFSDLRA